MQNTLMLLAGVAAMAFSIWARWLLWCWFVVPAGGPALSALHIAGLYLLLTPLPERTPDKSDLDRMLDLAWMTAGMAFFLLVGFAFSFAVAS